MQKVLLTFGLTVLLSLTSACSVLGVYRIDIPQGTPLTQSQVGQLKIGMTQQQVRYVLGSPSLTDSLNNNRWDYVYHYIPGTYAKEAGRKTIQDQHLVLYFADNKLVQIEGQDSIPVRQKDLPDSKDANLTADPL